MDGGIENDSLKPMIWHFHIKKSRHLPHCSAVCGSIFKIKARICSSRISTIQKWPNFWKKFAKKWQEQPLNQKEFPMTLIAGAKRCLKKSPNAILNPSKVSQALLFICSINFEGFECQHMSGSWGNPILSTDFSPKSKSVLPPEWKRRFLRVKMNFSKRVQGVPRLNWYQNN